MSGLEKRWRCSGNLSQKAGFGGQNHRQRSLVESSKRTLIPGGFEEGPILGNQDGCFRNNFSSALFLFSSRVMLHPKNGVPLAKQVLTRTVSTSFDVQSANLGLHPQLPTSSSTVQDRPHRPRLAKTQPMQSGSHPLQAPLSDPAASARLRPLWRRKPMPGSGPGSAFSRFKSASCYSDGLQHKSFLLLVAMASTLVAMASILLAFCIASGYGFWPASRATQGEQKDAENVHELMHELLYNLLIRPVASRVHELVARPRNARKKSLRGRSRRVCSQNFGA